jgi:hypothetical protein
LINQQKLMAPPVTNLNVLDLIGPRPDLAATLANGLSAAPGIAVRAPDIIARITVGESAQK